MLRGTAGLAAASEISKLGDLAAEAGLHRVSMLAWRDLDDPEAGRLRGPRVDRRRAVGRGRASRSRCARRSPRASRR